MISHKIWECLICGFVYDESLGMPEDNIAPGTPWEDIPDDWWAAAGLARTLDRGLSASMDSPNTEGASRTTRDN